MTDAEWKAWGYKTTTTACRICGTLVDCKIEPRFGYSACREHSDTSPVSVPLDIKGKPYELVDRGDIMKQMGLVNTDQAKAIIEDESSAFKGPKAQEHVDALEAKAKRLEEISQLYGNAKLVNSQPETYYQNLIEKFAKAGIILTREDLEGATNLYTLAASRYFGVKVEDVTHNQRTEMKSRLFAVLYNPVAWGNRPVTLTTVKPNSPPAQIVGDRTEGIEPTMQKPYYLRRTLGDVIVSSPDPQTHAEILQSLIPATPISIDELWDRLAEELQPRIIMNIDELKCAVRIANYLKEHNLKVI